MPGAVQVTVLEFKGVSSLSQLPAESLKVSMGNREFQTWDKGEFSFPITNLRDDLVVALVDAAGSKIAHLGRKMWLSGPRLDIRTMHIIEKGCWEEVFIISGCGHVHMKLQFVLSEEDRTRIRLMRESVVKKKLEVNPGINLRLSEIPSDSAETLKEHDQASASAGLSSDSATSPAVLLCHQKEERSSLGPAISDTTDHGGHDRDESISPKGHETAPADKIESQPFADTRPVMEAEGSSTLSGSSISDSAAFRSQDDQSQESWNGRCAKRTPSNVRKMISAFESSQIQEMHFLKLIPSVQTQLNRSRMKGLLENQEPKAVAYPPDERMRQIKDYSARNLHQTPTTVSRCASVVAIDETHEEFPSTVPIPSEGRGLMVKTAEEMEKSPMMQSTLDTEAGSRRTVEAQLPVSRAYEEVSTSEAKSLECCQGECSSTQSSGTWLLFPDDTRRLCITTASEQIQKVIDHHSNEAKTYQIQKIFSESTVEKDVTHGTEYKIEKNIKETADRPESGLSSSPEDSSKGLIGKVIKIAAILGFGLLVVLTRQKEPRKKQNREEDDNLFSILEFVEERK